VSALEKEKGYGILPLWENKIKKGGGHETKKR